MFGENSKRGFSLLEFLFAASLLAALTAVGLFAVQRQAKTDFLQKDISEMDHVAYSILAIISLEIRNAGPHILFVNGGGAINSNNRQCDPKSVEKKGTDCITLDTLKYDKQGDKIQKSFFVEQEVLKLRNSDSSRTQSLTPPEEGIKVEDFQVSFLSGGPDFQNSIENGKTVEAVRITLTIRSRGTHKNQEDAYIRKTYSIVSNPRNI